MNTTQQTEMPEAENMVFVPPKMHSGLVRADGVDDKIQECLTLINSAPDIDLRKKLFNSLQSSLERIGNLIENSGRPGRLMLDFAPLSFTFSAGGLFGGLIFHGQHDGGGSGGPPTFSVCLEATHGWSLHT